MPRYDYECPTHGDREEATNTVADRLTKAPLCRTCRRPKRIVITSPQVRKEFLPYFDRGAGRYFLNREQKREYVRQRGLEEF
jgi:putative FmdB family regulatory protein